MKKVIVLSLLALFTVTNVCLADGGGRKKKASTCQCDKVKKERKPRKSKSAEASGE